MPYGHPLFLYAGLMSAVTLADSVSHGLARSAHYGASRRLTKNGQRKARCRMAKQSRQRNRR